MAAGSHKPLPLPARPLFRPPVRPIHTLPPLDAVRALAADVVRQQGPSGKALMEEIAAKDAAAKAAEQQASADLVAGAIAEKLEGLFTTLTAHYADDAYNAAILANPEAFAAMQGLGGIVVVPDATNTVRVCRNDFLVPAVVVLRADNDPSNDVQAVLVAAAQVPNSSAQAVGGTPTVIATALLRPGQVLYAGVRANTTPANIVYTIIPLRGRAAVFGG